MVELSRAQRHRRRQGEKDGDEEPRPRRDEASRTGPKTRYNDRRKLSRSCFWLAERARNCAITPLASDPVLAC
jgi:hypothetical protein